MKYFQYFFADSNERVQTRRLIWIGLGLLYANIFLIYINQSAALFSKNGLTEYSQYHALLNQQSKALGLSSIELFLRLPSLFHYTQSDWVITAVGWLGLTLSLPLVFGFANKLILFILWFLQLSIVNSGQIFYGYGWETQILDLTTIVFFMTPWLNGRSDFAPKNLIFILLQWMLFRLMLCAGLIKIRGDECWRDLTCLNFHFETQPNPNPLSWYIHKFPETLLKAGVFFNHFVELIIPFGYFGPRKIRIFCGVVTMVFQFSLILSGNLSWLNWITLVMCLACFDDDILNSICNQIRSFFKIKKVIRQPTKEFHLLKNILPYLALTIVWIVLSYPTLLNLLSTEQKMNSSYSGWHFVNNYGAFGHVGKLRTEIIISGSKMDNPTERKDWLEYEFICKPGNINRRPCLITPYHLRLDWQIWFSAMRPQLQEEWLLRLAVRILENDSNVISLLSSNPFSDKAPKWIKMDLYQYRFSELGDNNSLASEKDSWEFGAWWNRKFLKVYLPPVAIGMKELEDFRNHPN